RLKAAQETQPSVLTLSLPTRVGTTARWVLLPSRQTLGVTTTAPSETAHFLITRPAGATRLSVLLPSIKTLQAITTSPWVTTLALISRPRYTTLISATRVWPESPIPFESGGLPSMPLLISQASAV